MAMMNNSYSLQSMPRDKMLDLVKKNISVMYITNTTLLIDNTVLFYLENNEYYFCSISIIRRLIDRA